MMSASASASASASPASSSNAIAIPARKNKCRATTGPSSHSTAGSGSCYGGSFGSPSATPSCSPGGARRRESLMSATFSRAEHTVVDVGEEESPRLITCVKASQGFDWNQEIFLPSYADYQFDDLERRQDPVEDIIVTEEEVKKMFPQ